MKRSVIIAFVVATLSLTAAETAFAGSSTDAALGLGAFAVFNQILGGVGVFGAQPTVVAPAPVVVAPAPVVVAPPPPVVYAPPRVIYAPPPVVYTPPPVAYYPPPPPQPVVVYPNGYAYGAPRYYYRSHRRHHHDDDDD